MPQDMPPKGGYEAVQFKVSFVGGWGGVSWWREVAVAGLEWEGGDRRPRGSVGLGLETRRGGEEGEG